MIKAIWRQHAHVNFVYKQFFIVRITYFASFSINSASCSSSSSPLKNYNNTQMKLKVIVSIKSVLCRIFYYTIFTYYSSSSSSSDIAITDDI
jgi:hypothetical protein